MAIIGTDLIATLNTLEQIEAIGRTVGNTDPCNPAKTVEIIIELIMDLYTDLNNNVISIAKLAGKNSLFIVLALLQEMIGPVLLAGYESLVGFIMGNVLGTLLQAIALLLSSLEGIWMILMYLAAGQTMTAVIERQTFLKYHVVGRIDSLIELFTLLQDINWGQEFLDDFDDAKKAYDHVYTASLILGTELDNSGAILASTTGNVTTDVSITEFTGGGISTPNLKKAEDEISSAIDILFGGKYSEMLDRANSVFNSAGLSLNGSNNFGQVHIPDGLFTDIEFASELGIPELDYLNHEYNDGNTVIALTWDNYNTILKNLWKASANTGKLLNWEAFLGDLPDFMRIIALQTIVDEGMADLAKKVPMFGSGIADSLKLMNKLADENGLDEQQLFSMDKKDLGSALDELRAVSDNVEKFTLKKVNNKVAVSEFAILLLKNNYFTATWAGNMVALALIPLLQQLTIVREDMKSSLGLSDSSAASAAHGISAYKKLYWGGLLENVKIGLKTFTTGVTIPGMGEMNFFDDTNAESVEEKWDALVIYLTDLGDQQPADVAYDLLQNLPAKAIKTIAEGNPNSPFEGNYQLPSVSEDQKNNSPAEFLAYLQDVRYNLNQALIVDSDVYNQCKDIRDTIEENDTFEVLMELWEQLTSNLTGPFAGLGEELSAGNLNSLVNALSEFSAAFSVVGTVGHCVKEFVAPQATTLNLSLDPNMTPEEFALAEQTSAAAKQVQEASDAVLKSLSGISDDEEFNEFLERKEQLKIEFLNESAKINDLLTRLTLLYTMVT